MAAESTSNFNPNRARVVQLALTKVGAIGPGALNVAQDAAPLVAHANDTLSILLKSMDRDGIMEWRAGRRTLTTTPSLGDYTLPNDVYDIDEPGRYTVAGSTSATIVTSMSRHEYMSLGDRTLTGTPIRFWCENGLDANGIVQIVLHFYPLPATVDSFEYVAVTRARDVGVDTDTLDITQKWLRCLVWGLAAELAPDYGLPMDRVQFFQGKFDTEREACLEDDNERGDVQIAPFATYYNSGYGSRGRI